MKVDGIGVALGVGGFVLLWSGVKNAGVGNTLKALLKGNPNPDPGGVGGTSTGTPTAGWLSNSGASLSGGTVAGTPPYGAASGMGGNPSSNQALGKMLASTYGWHVDPYWSALVSLWNSKSGWSNTIWNTSSSCGNDAFAFGIPQACGHGVSKSIPGHGSVCPYPAGNPANPPECGGSSDAGAPITWGLIYIKQNYGDPTRAPHGGY